MPESVLAALRLVFLAALYLFLARVLRAVWVEIFAERRSAAESVRSGQPNVEPAPRRAATPAPAPAAAPPPKGRKAKAQAKSAALVLKVVEPPERRGTTYDLADEMTIGRADGCTVRVDDTFASQLHARMFRRDGRCFVEDLGSTNGTFLNRKPVHGPITIERGDRLQIGNTVLELSR